MLKGLTQGKWTRPTDKSAVYLEIAPGCKWGIRVTLMEDYAKVEAIDSPNKPLYKAPERYSTVVKPPTFFEKLKGLTFEDKVLAAVADKRRVAAEENHTLRSSSEGSQVPVSSGPGPSNEKRKN
ncbi:MAG TPA: hypothetical protein GX008_09265 [Firmicutes bacterium]|nr:MAG: hypothetical protein AA931_04105 [Peptococcaceae bacterium 1109]HHT73887.1 hypothetical protein [Bacillota bacterium]